jgi:hypothetical protein
MFSTISALETARQHSKVSHDSNNSKSPDITKFGHFGVPKTTLRYFSHSIAVQRSDTHPVFLHIQTDLFSFSIESNDDCKQSVHLSHVSHADDDTPVSEKSPTQHAVSQKAALIFQ